MDKNKAKSSPSLQNARRSVPKRESGDNTNVYDEIPAMRQDEPIHSVMEQRKESGVTLANLRHWGLPRASGARNEKEESMDNDWTKQIADLTESRDQWRREWRLLNAALIKAEERMQELEKDCDGYRNGQDQLQDMLNTVMDSNAKLAAENKRLRAALGGTTDDAKPWCAPQDTAAGKP